MAEITEREINAIHETHDKVIRMETLLGNGNKGLCSDVQSQGKRLHRVELIIAGLIGSGVLGGSIVGISKLLGS